MRFEALSGKIFNKKGSFFGARSSLQISMLRALENF